jgi:protein SCO1/2
MMGSSRLTPKRVVQYAALGTLGALVSVGLFSAFLARENATTAAPLPVAAPSNLAGSPVEPPLVLPHTDLQDTTGQLFALHPGEKPLLLLYFGYSRCLTICSGTLSAIANARDQLTPSERDRVQVVVVSTDPEYDTPAVMRDWLANFDPAFVGLTGYRVIVQELMAALRLSSSTTSSNVLIFEPDGVAHRSYPPNTPAATYAHDLSALLATIPGS